MRKNNALVSRKQSIVDAAVSFPDPLPETEGPQCLAILDAPLVDDVQSSVFTRSFSLALHFPKMVRVKTAFNLSRATPSY